MLFLNNKKTQSKKQSGTKYEDNARTSCANPALIQEPPSFINMWFKIMFPIVTVCLSIGLGVLIYGSVSNQNSLTVSGSIVFVLATVCLIVLLVLYSKKRRLYLSNKNDMSNMQVFYGSQQFQDDGTSSTISTLQYIDGVNRHNSQNISINSPNNSVY